MVSLACQDRRRYPGMEFFSVFGRTTGGAAAARSAGALVDRDAAAGGAPGFGVEHLHDQHQYVLNRAFRFAGGICAGAYAVSRSQPVRDIGNLTFGISPCGCRSGFTADFRAFWLSWPLSYAVGYYDPFYDTG